jgi:mono/diheme cytochrome c family protein
LKSTTLMGIALLGAAVLLSGCRGQTSRKPPLFIMHGMEFQPRYNAFEGNTYFEDGRNMRTPPEGTVARGQLKADDAFNRGGDTLNPVAKIPVDLTTELMERGRVRYNIYCTPCHSASGAGNGMVVKRGFLPPPSLHDERIVQMPDGQIFQVISRGVRNMPSYGKQIPEADRWAIVAYIRALQHTRLAGGANGEAATQSN